MANITENIKNALEFYRALGFENLPIKFRKKTVPFAPPEISAPHRQHQRPVGQRPRSSDSEGAERRRTKGEALDALREQIGECRRCGLSDKRTHIVFGEGDPDARLMFIGEAPGKEEDLQARPFVGEAGMLLSRLIEKMGFRREDVYIANVVKCRPPLNRDPEKEEMDSCRSFLIKQIEIVGPDVIMALGRISSLTLIGNPDLKITAIRGKFFDFRGIPLMPTFHPAYLMRNPRDKWLTWSDAQKVLGRLGGGS